jgi:hypothetical protein
MHADVDELLLASGYGAGYADNLNPRPYAVQLNQHYLPTSDSTAYQPPPQTPSAAD